VNIAIVEDDINMRKSLEIALSDYEEFKIKSYKNAKDALKKMSDDTELVITDIQMPGMDGIEFLNELDGKFESIVITGNATLNRAVEALRLGAKDFITKPFEVETLVEAIKRSRKVNELLSTKHVSKVDDNNTNKDFLGSSKALEKSLSMAKRAAVTDASILLLGESGVGKELFANYIHNNSNRKDKPFIAINMAAIPDNLLESELFGYEKGAFTDASEARAGKFELANGGTIFLDEMGEMPIKLQAKLLRALQEKEITRLGSSKHIKIDVRVVSATNANLKEQIKDGEFREDLYYRLNTIPIHIAPLRDRKDEILDIADKILGSTCAKYQIEQKEFAEDTKVALLNYKWPGNIRELISVVERAAILSETEQIHKDDLFLESRESKSINIEDLEKDLITEVLNSCDRDIKSACDMLGFSKRVLEKKIEKYGL
jgi:two-component system NtrC family response regulator/two-component system response regulator FlrC